VDISYRKYKANNLMLYNEITRPFSGQLAGYRQGKGSTDLDTISTEDAECLERARRYGAQIQLPVEESTSTNSVYAVYESVQSSDKDIYTFDKDVNKVIPFLSTFDNSESRQTYKALCPSKRSIGFSPEALERVRVNSPLVWSSRIESESESVESYMYGDNDLDPPSDIDPEVLSIQSQLDKERSLPAKSEKFEVEQSATSSVFVARIVENKVSPESQPSSSSDSNERASPINWDFPFPDEEHMCLMINPRVMVRFIDSDTLTSWFLARESHIPEIRNRWKVITAFLNSAWIREIRRRRVRYSLRLYQRFFSKSTWSIPAR
jgi:hypothetical protein